MDNSNKYGIGAKDVYDKLYNRLENDNILFWNRMPFYVIIFGLCATGYGYSVFKLFSQDNITELFIHSACLIIALIGFIAALFWVIISKGSRYWFEKYFETIYHYERPDEEGLTYDKETKKVIITLKAGSYSMGKAQMLMGQLMMGLWAVIFIIHGVKILTDATLYNFLVNINQRDFILIFSGIIIFIKMSLMFKTSLIKSKEALTKLKKSLIKIKQSLKKNKASPLKSKELIKKSKKSFRKIKKSVLKKEGLFVKIKYAFRKIKESLMQLKASPSKRKELIKKSKEELRKIKYAHSTMEKVLVKIDKLALIIKKLIVKTMELIIKAIECLIKIIERLIKIKFFVKMKLFIKKHSLAIIAIICVSIYIMHLKLIGEMLLCFLILDLIIYTITNALKTDGMNSHEKIRDNLYKK